MIFIMINTCVIILRQTSERHGWDPSYKGALYPFMQIWGILAGLFLIYFIGTKAVVGASAAIVSGLLTYYLYGHKNAKIAQTPFQTILGKTEEKSE